MLNCSQPCMVYMTIWGYWGVSDVDSLIVVGHAISFFRGQSYFLVVLDLPLLDLGNHEGSNTLQRSSKEELVGEGHYLKDYISLDYYTLIDDPLLTSYGVFHHIECDFMGDVNA